MIWPSPAAPHAGHARGGDRGVLDPWIDPARSSRPDVL
jgi:hypothetical protein